MNFHGKDIKIFTANSNPMVAKRIAECLGLPLGKSEVGTFSDGEIAVSLFESVRGSDCFIVQSTCSPVNNNIMELLIMIDAMKRASAARITAVIPYFGYARQDRKAKARDPISAKLVADLITTAGADRVLTMDLHAPQIQGFFNIPVDHLVGAPTLASFLRGRIGRDNEEYVVVSPDLGSVTRARNFASRLGCPLAIIDKRRQRANVCEVMNIIGDVKGKKVILVDDMIDTAGTLCNGAAAIIEKGGALEVTAAATHGVLSGPAIERIADSPIKELILLDTVPVTGERKLDKMTILSVAPLFAEAIERIYEDKPVSPCSSKYMLPRPVPPGRGYPRQGRFPWPWKPFPCLKSRPLRRERGLAGDFSFSALDMLGFGFGVPRQPADLTLLYLCGRLGQAGAGAFRIFKR